MIHNLERLLNRLWDAIKAAPGVSQVGYGIATVLGLYRVDRWLIDRECRADLKLADELDGTAFSEQAEKLRASATTRLIASRKVIA